MRKSIDTWVRNHKPYKQSCKTKEAKQFHQQQELGTNHLSNWLHCKHQIKETQNKSCLHIRDGPKIWHFESPNDFFFLCWLFSPCTKCDCHIFCPCLASVWKLPLVYKVGEAQTTHYCQISWGENLLLQISLLQNLKTSIR